MNSLGIFSKYWEPGSVNTRLAAIIGESAAAEVHRQFTLFLLERMQNVADRQVLVYTPAARCASFEAIAPSAWEIAPQREGDLGERMETFIKQQFQQGAKRVILLGCDSPQLSPETILHAFDLLKKVSVVVGPSDDGGYYLLGCSTPAPIFQGIPWGSDSVWEKTKNLLQEWGGRWEELPVSYDVDTYDDLERLRADLNKRALQDSSLERLLQSLEYAVPIDEHSP